MLLASVSTLFLSFVCRGLIVLAMMFLTTTSAYWAVAQDHRLTLQRRTYSANLASEIAINTVHATWCYDTEPSFIFTQGGTLLRGDLAGHVTKLLESPAQYIGLAFCSQDGHTISFFSRPNKPDGKIDNDTLRLSILDTASNKSADYFFASPLFFDPGSNSLMSLDGGSFALPSEPILVSGPDILRDKRVVKASSGYVFWTKQFVFIREGEPTHYRIRRTSDLSDLGTIDFAGDRPVKGIFECMKSYLVHYSGDTLQQEVLEPTSDSRLGITRKIKLVRVGVVDQGEAICSVTLMNTIAGREVLSGLTLLEENQQSSVDLHSIKGLSTWLTTSKDGRLVLGIRDLGDPGHKGRDRSIAVLRIQR
jgi:hypothetical protein